MASRFATRGYQGNSRRFLRLVGICIVRGTDSELCPCERLSDPLPAMLSCAPMLITKLVKSHVPHHGLARQRPVRVRIFSPLADLMTIDQPAFPQLHRRTGILANINCVRSCDWMDFGIEVSRQQRMMGDC